MEKHVLILSSNNGKGHNYAANALLEHFSNQNCNCEILDALSFVSVYVSKIISKVHYSTFVYSTDLYNLFYKHTENSRKILSKGSFFRKVLDLGIDNLSKYIIDNDIDCVLSTHIFGAILAEDACNKWYIKIPKAFIATDYSCTPGVEELNDSKIFIADKCLLPKFNKLLGNSSKIICSGIPIQKNFLISNKIFHRNLHVLINLSTNNKSFKKILFKNLTRINYKNVKVRIICKNKEFFDDFLNYQNENLIVINEVESMDKQLDWADVYVTKPGGLSVAESISKKVVMLLYLVIKANEEDNCEYVYHKNFGMFFMDYQKLFDCLINIAEQPELIEKYRISLNKTNTKNACEFVYNSMSRYF